ncbi:MAG: hypothetical protein JWR15_3374, partial [Prosthecobacter sp.]|nr:hypothetical protein [Prosthecobacter sp.]
MNRIPSASVDAQLCERVTALAEQLLTTALSQQTQKEHAEAEKL